MQWSTIVLFWLSHSVLALTLLEPREIEYCQTPLGNGTCIPIANCPDGTSVAGYCKGSSDMQCCVRTCQTSFGQGFCQNTQRNCTGGNYISGKCPGNANTQCCVSYCTPSAGVQGGCFWTGSPCGDSYVAGLCPGGNDIMCCPGGNDNVLSKTCSSVPKSNMTITTASTPPVASSTGNKSCPPLPNPKTDLSNGTIAGITVASSVCVGTISAFLVWLMMRRRKVETKAPWPTGRSFSGPVAWRGPELDEIRNGPTSNGETSTNSPITSSPHTDTSATLYNVQELHGDPVHEMRGHKE